MNVSPAIVVLSLVAALLPSAGYVGLVWLIDRYEKEPLRLLTATFVWGAIPAVIVSFIFEALVSVPLANLAGGGSLLSASLVAPLVEESAKTLILLALYYFARWEFDDALDGIVYGALVGLGFGLTENIFYFLRSFQEGGPLSWAMTVGMRSFIFGLNHALYSGTVGAALGYARLTSQRKQRRSIVVVGFILATLLHATHNTLVSASFGQLCPGFLVAISSDWLGLVTLLVLVILAWRKERSWIMAELPEEVALGVLSDEEYSVLAAPRPRLTTYWRRWQGQGWSRARRWRAILQQATELAFKKHQLKLAGRDPTANRIVEQLRLRIIALRQELGQPVSAMVCLSCGATTRPGSKFCAQCGRPLSVPSIHSTTAQERRLG